VKPSALILGGTGFVGSHLTRQLADRYSVTTVGRKVDIRDELAVRELVSRSKPDVVVNLAAITTVRETFEQPADTYAIGFSGLLNLLNALRDSDFRGCLLSVSSSEVYGFPSVGDLPLAEASPLRPMSPYAVAKAAGEMLCYQWSQSASFRIVRARPFTHIGPGQSRRFAVARFAREIAEIIAGAREPQIEVGNLEVSRDLADVRDVARAYDLILHAGGTGQVYNVCSGREVGMRSVLDQLIELAGRPIRVVENTALVRAAEQQRTLGSAAALTAATGWTATIPLARTLADTLAFALRDVQTLPTGMRGAGTGIQSG
jgi:GDP-4-dehydro-6-deoxy-D-mannose reductase